jgi:16S rRNA U516 pseudouridylate synthase RsuA-like enzyme
MLASMAGPPDERARKDSTVSFEGGRRLPRRREVLDRDRRRRRWQDRHEPRALIDPALSSVALDGEPLRTVSKTYLLLHKPKGYLTTYRDPQGRRTVYDLLPQRDRFLFPVGRLDLDTSGLLVMTNDSSFAETLTNPECKVAKTYFKSAIMQRTAFALIRLLLLSNYF